MTAALRDEGSTLVESLVAVSILGIAMTAMVGGMYTSVVASDANRKHATASTHLASYAERVKADVYVGCATSYAGAGFTIPAGYTKDAVVVSYWDGSTFAATCTTDSGLQRVSLRIRSTDGRAVVDVDLAKRAA